MTLPDSMSSFESNPVNKEFMIWSISQEIIKLKEDDESKGRIGHQKLWKRRAAKLFKVDERTIGNWVKKYKIRTRNERYESLRTEAIASLKNLRKSG